MSLLLEFTQAIFYDAVTLLGFLVPVFLGVFAVGSLILGREK